MLLFLDVFFFWSLVCYLWSDGQTDRKPLFKHDDFKSYAAYGVVRLPTKARFKRRATAVPNSTGRIKFDLSTAVARRLEPSRATAV